MSDQISTIFISGLALDTTEREFKNMFLFCEAFEKCKIVPAISFTFIEDEGLSSAYPSVPIGVAKFKSNPEAIKAIDWLSGKVVDNKKEMVLKPKLAIEEWNLVSGEQSEKQEEHLPTQCSLSRQDMADYEPLLSDMASSPTTSSSSSSLTLNESCYSKQFMMHKKLQEDYIESLLKSEIEQASQAQSSPLVELSKKFMDSENGLENALSSLLDKPFQSFKTKKFDFNVTPLDFSKFKHAGNSLDRNEELLSPPNFIPRPTTTNSATIARPNIDNNPPCDTLFIGNLPLYTGEDDILNLVKGQFGFRKLLLTPSKKPNNPPLCFIQFSTDELATEAMSLLNGAFIQVKNEATKIITGAYVRISYAKNPLGIRKVAIPTSTLNPTASPFSIQFSRPSANPFFPSPFSDPFSSSVSSF